MFRIASGKKKMLIPFMGIGLAIAGASVIKNTGFSAADEGSSLSAAADTQNVIVAAYRVFNLATCVTQVCAGYLYHDFHRKLEKSDSEFKRLEAELLRLQEEEKQLTLRHNESGYIDLAGYQQESGAVRDKILRIADSLSAMKQEVLSRVHTHSAEAFRDLCMRNRGVYIKLGQHLSQLDYILPDEYCVVLSALLDKNPVSDYASVCAMFQEEFTTGKRHISTNVSNSNSNSSSADSHSMINNIYRDCNSDIIKMSKGEHGKRNWLRFGAGSQLKSESESVSVSGSLPSDLFATFDPQPIASASLAQVHLATGHDGRRYAVKVQHPSLRHQAKGDLVAIGYALQLVSYIFPSFKYQWLMRELTNNLPVELNFENEVSNMEKCRVYLKNMVDAGDVVIPTVNKELSTARVLTMSFESGLSIGQLSRVYSSMEDKGTTSRGTVESEVGERDGAGALITSVSYCAADVAHLISQTFAEQIFRHGFVHCDPHEANLHVRAHPFKANKPQLILLDHGLYRELNPEFKYHYNRLWQGLVSSDFSTIERECKALQVTSSVSLFAALLTMKPWSVIMSNNMSSFHRPKGQPNNQRTHVAPASPEIRLGTPGSIAPSSGPVLPSSTAENEVMRRYAMKYHSQVQELLNTLPSDMILLFKTNDCLRHLDSLLGAPVNTITVVATTTSDIILAEDVAAAMSRASTSSSTGSSSSSRSVSPSQSWMQTGYAVGNALLQWCGVRARVVALSWAPQVAFIVHQTQEWNDYFFPPMTPTALTKR